MTDKRQKLFDTAKLALSALFDEVKKTYLDGKFTYCSKSLPNNLTKAVDIDDVLLTRLVSHQLPQGGADSYLLFNAQKDNVSSSMNIHEAFGCCGKVYLDHLPGEPSLTWFLKLAIILANLSGYSYMGLVHWSESEYTNTAKKLGFKSAVSFTNKRSSKVLDELYLIL